MNTGIKALVKMGIDLFAAGKSAVAQENFVTVIMPKLYAVAMDVPAVAGGWAGLMDELVALKTAEADADLVAYLIASVSGVTQDEHAKAVLSAVLVALEHVVQDVISIQKAVTAV